MDRTIDPVQRRESKESAEDCVLVRVSSLMPHEPKQNCSVVVPIALLVEPDIANGETAAAVGPTDSLTGNREFGRPRAATPSGIRIRKTNTSRGNVDHRTRTVTGLAPPTPPMAVAPALPVEVEAVERILAGVVVGVWRCRRGRGRFGGSVR